MKKTLGDIFPNLKLANNLKALPVTGINDDSRMVAKGEIFFIRERKKFDIFSTLSQVEKKAAVLVGLKKHKNKLKDLNKKTQVILIDDFHKEFYQAIDNFYGLPRKRLVFIGITGTNGKTTTTNIIYHGLKSIGQEASLIGTIEYKIGDKVYPSKNTTPDYLTLSKLFQHIDPLRPHYVVMEVSSHGIEQGRIKKLPFYICAFTNLSRDHLDYHKTMDNYFKAKKKLFLDNKNAIAIINHDDYYARKLAKETKMLNFSFGVNGKVDLLISNIKLTKDNSSFNLTYKDATINTVTKLIGLPNIYNLSLAVSVFLALKFSLQEILGMINQFNQVEGRLERVFEDIYVDYAHTPDALEKVLIVLRQIGYEKIVCVFGCGGDRDKGKRAMMGKIASLKADYTFITSDNPRSEDPLDICYQIKSGFENNSCLIVVDRREAILEGIKKKASFDKACLLVAGKGHENYQIVKSEKFNFKDKDVILESLELTYV